MEPRQVEPQPAANHLQPSLDGAQRQVADAVFRARRNGHLALATNADGGVDGAEIVDVLAQVQADARLAVAAGGDAEVAACLVVALGGVDAGVDLRPAGRLGLARGFPSRLLRGPRSERFRVRQHGPRDLFAEGLQRQAPAGLCRFAGELEQERHLGLALGGK